MNRLQLREQTAKSHGQELRPVLIICQELGSMVKGSMDIDKALFRADLNILKTVRDTWDGSPKDSYFDDSVLNLVRAVIGLADLETLRSPSILEE